MSDRMIPIPFGDLMNRALTEYTERGTVFGVSKLYRHESGKTLPIFGEKIETPFGPAAGPHTQLAQNLIASYVGGSRFFELKTVQTLDGEALPVAKPCILAEDEGYNVEWSTELHVPEAMDEYIKGWYAIKLLSGQLGLGAPDGFVFNMSVGYDLAGIKTEKINSFIEGLKDASKTACWAECRAWAETNLSRLDRLDMAYLDALCPRVCRSVTLSTLHGCPAGDIEAIASYLLREKGLNTYIKCNPTLLGYTFVRETMDKMGYGYLAFDDSHFKADLQFEEAVPMLRRLKALADSLDLAFGVKLTNTFPVGSDGALPGEEMYMSGKSLYPLAIGLTHRLAEALDGELPISYSGGADLGNIGEIFACGVWPITVSTVLLKQGGYNRLLPMAQRLCEMAYTPFAGVDVPALSALSEAAQTDPRYCKGGKKPPKPVPNIAGPECEAVCGSCVDTCPNRANIVVEAEGGKRLLHMDSMCNECGNCTVFCPFGYVPYRDKLTLFAGAEDMTNSANDGFYVVDKVTGLVFLRQEGEAGETAAVANPWIAAFLRDYSYCI